MLCTEYPKYDSDTYLLFYQFADRIKWCHLVAQFSRFSSWIFSGMELQFSRKKNSILIDLYYIFQEYNNYSSLHHAYLVQDYSNHTFHISLTGMEFQFHEKNVYVNFFCEIWIYFHSAHVLIALEEVTDNLQGDHKIYVSTAKQKGLSFLGPNHILLYWQIYITGHKYVDFLHLEGKVVP